MQLLSKSLVRMLRHMLNKSFYHCFIKEMVLAAKFSKQETSFSHTVYFKLCSGFALFKLHSHNDEFLNLIET